MRRSLLFLILAVLALSGVDPAWSAPSPSAKARAIQVFAAASLKEAVDEVGQAFEARTQVKVRVTYASSAQLARQIDQGAPADAFISADLEWMDWAAGRGLIQPETRHNIAGNRLVLIAPVGSPIRKVELKRGIDLAPLLGDGRLAIGDPASVPAGKYGQAALTSLGAWDGVSARLAPAENVRAALAFVAHGEAPLGIVYATDALADPRVKVVAAFPASSHPPIIYPGAVVKSAHDRFTAQVFLAYLGGPAGQTILKRHGFAPPPK